MKNIIFITCSTILFFACNKDNDIRKENSMTCKINGTSWKTNKPGYYIYNGPNGSTLDISGSINDISSGDLIEILLPSTITTGDLSLSLFPLGRYQKLNIVGVYDTGNNGSTGGQVTIKKHDKTSIEGSFNFSAAKSNNPNDIINITEGNFVIYF